jgi:hypothetical protein
VTVRVRFADLRSVTRSVTLSAPISATTTLAEIAEDLVRGVLADHPDEKTISLLGVAVSNLEAHAVVQLELPLGLADEARRPGTQKGVARHVADRAVDTIRDRFGWEAVGYVPSPWGFPVRFPTRSASSPKRTCDHHGETSAPASALSLVAFAPQCDAPRAGRRSQQADRGAVGSTARNGVLVPLDPNISGGDASRL